MTEVSSISHFSSDVADKITQSIQRLNHILPLKANQSKLSPELRTIHRKILAAYIEKGRSLTKDELGEFDIDLNDVIKVLDEMALVVFNPQQEPIGAYPFTMEEREHQVLVNGHKVHSMCAMDALSISPMFKIPLEIHSQCRLSHEPIKIIQNIEQVENATEVADCFFAINWNAAAAGGCCADSLCTEMSFIKGEAAAQQWRAEEPEQRDIYPLEQAIAFGAGFFVPLMND